MKNIKKIILALDGMALNDVYVLIRELFYGAQGAMMKDMISMIQYSDIVHALDIEVLEMAVAKPIPGVGLYLDLKLADMITINAHIASQYSRLLPDIITIRENVHPQSVAVIRKILPQSKIALVCALTDIPIHEFQRDFRMRPCEYIAFHLRRFERYLGDETVDAFVCSFLEVERLKNEFPQYRAIVSGMREAWTPKSIYHHCLFADMTVYASEVIKLGADFVIMGNELLHGNKTQGLSAQEMRAQTYGHLLSLSS